MAKISKQWKALERIAAKKLGGKRKLRRAFDFGIKDSDVDHPIFCIDCKYGKQVPITFWNRLKEASYDGIRLRTKAGVDYYLITLDALVDYMKTGMGSFYEIPWERNAKKFEGWREKIITDYINGNMGDDGKIPLVVMKSPRQTGEMCFILCDDFYDARDWWHKYHDKMEKLLKGE